MVRAVLRNLEKYRMVPKNPIAAQAQKLSEDVRKRMMENESTRNRYLEMQREAIYGEDENKLYAGERRRAESEGRLEVEKAMKFLMKEKKINRVEAYALAVAYSREIASLEQELIAASQGPIKARAVAVAMREELLKVFKDPQLIGQLIKESKSQEKGFSQSIMAQVRDQVFEKYNVNIG